jgi:hypothetical protein
LHPIATAGTKGTVMEQRFAPVRIQRVDPEQDLVALQALVKNIEPILAEGEEILYVALPDRTPLSLEKDSIAVTSSRIVLCNGQPVGRPRLTEFLWHEIDQVRLNGGILAAEIIIESVSGELAVMGGLDKSQARRLHSVCQQKQQEWHDNRRTSPIEVYSAKASDAQKTATGTTTVTAEDDTVEKLEKIKLRLAQQLISEAEYEALKAKILAQT